MKTTLRKTDFPVTHIRKYLEPGPVVLVSSKWKEQENIMTMGWHTVMEFSPSLIGCIIAESNHSFGLIRSSGECVINIPTADMIEQVIGIGTTSGEAVDKFSRFHLDRQPSTFVSAPGIRQCYASFECKVFDETLVKRLNFFVFEVVKAHVAPHPEFPGTIHYRGGGHFMVSGKELSFRERFRDDPYA